ncbi:mechanosensitive ion channel family protein [Thiovibrio sp. JS02]
MNFHYERLLELGGPGVAVVIIVALGILVYFILKKALVTLLGQQAITHPLYVVIRNILKWLIFTVVAVIVLQQIGIGITSVFTALLTVAGMVAIGFIAVWSILSNMFCALFLILFKVFQVGDEIEVVEPVGGEGLRGTVLGFNLMFTTLGAGEADPRGGFTTQIPNNIFFQKAIRRRPGARTESLGKHLLGKPLPFKLNEE